VIGGLQALVVPLLASVEARLKLAATLAVRRAALVIAATLFGVGALLFLSVGVFFALLPGVGAAGAALILALIWALLAALCFALSLVRPRSARAAALPPPAVTTRAPPVAPDATPARPRPGMAEQVNRAAPLLAIAALAAGLIAGRR
jgi:hypothetical protein